MKIYYCASLLLLLGCSVRPMSTSAEELVYEAEDYSELRLQETRQWVKVPVDSASGGAALQILPDTRVTHDDPFKPGVNFAREPGLMTIVDYRIRIPAPGRYYVWVKALFRGTEDNGVHVGLNGEWPESGQRLQWCEGRGAWKWESKQRTQEEHCGVPRLIYLDFPTAGQHLVSFSMREDGFLFDQWALTKSYSPPKTVR